MFTGVFEIFQVRSSSMGARVVEKVRRVRRGHSQKKKKAWTKKLTVVSCKGTASKGAWKQIHQKESWGMVTYERQY